MDTHTGRFSCKIHGKTAETERAPRHPSSFVTRAAVGTAGWGDSRDRLGSSWYMSVCWVWAAAGWAAQTKGWMAEGLQRWEKGGGRRRAGWRGDWLIALFGGGGLSATTTATWGPLLKCFSSSLPPVISPVSCCHQLIASQGPCMSPTRSCLQISFCFHPERGPVPLRSLSGRWGPTCSPVSWVHLLGGPLTAVPGCLCFRLLDGGQSWGCVCPAPALWPSPQQWLLSCWVALNPCHHRSLLGLTRTQEGAAFSRDPRASFSLFSLSLYT